MQVWLGTYALRTPGTKTACNATVRLDARNVAQPDGLLRVLTDYGGQTRIDLDGFISGPPELIVEIAATSAAMDLHAKLRAYRRAGVREYLVWRTRDHQLDWFVLEAGEYRLNSPDAKEICRSRQFPGLVLDVGALLADDAATVLDTLQRGLDEPAHTAFVKRLARKTP